MGIHSYIQLNSTRPGKLLYATQWQWAYKYETCSIFNRLQSIFVQAIYSQQIDKYFQAVHLISPPTNVFCPKFINRMKNIEIVISSVINRVLRSFICPTFNGYHRALSMLHTKFTHSPNKDPEKQINKSTSRFQNYKHAHEAVNGKEWKLSWLILVFISTKLMPCISLNKRNKHTSEKDQVPDFPQPGDLAGHVALHGRLLLWDLLSWSMLHKLPRAFQ